MRVFCVCVPVPAFLVCVPVPVLLVCVRACVPCVLRVGRGVGQEANVALRQCLDKPRVLLSLALANRIPDRNTEIGLTRSQVFDGVPQTLVAGTIWENSSAPIAVRGGAWGRVGARGGAWGRVGARGGVGARRGVGA